VSVTVKHLIISKGQFRQYYLKVGLRINLVNDNNELRYMIYVYFTSKIKCVVWDNVHILY